LKWAGEKSPACKLVMEDREIIKDTSSPQFNLDYRDGFFMEKIERVKEVLNERISNLEKRIQEKEIAKDKKTNKNFQLKIVLITAITTLIIQVIFFIFNSLINK
jgi:hypothetical protein